MVMQLKHLGPYEIGKPLGKGGMGSVYAATDTQTGQRVAVKALSPHLATAEGFRERFEAEIESLKTLRHEGIVRLYGYGEQDGMLFYSMEVVDGISLEDELKAGRRFNWREVTGIAIQLALALKHAHDHGIVHRDIKPANVLLYNEDRVKLADFGIARLFGTTQLTTAGGVLGTADYMSPEQAEGRPVTARCDQYSLGGVMYALLAGRPPFLAQNLPQMLQLQRFAQPDPVRRYAPDTPEQLEGLIAQLLAKDPADRFPNTQVLARHLQAMVRALSRPAADDFALARDEPTPPLAGNDRLATIEPGKPAISITKTASAPPTHGGSGGPAEAATVAADELSLPPRRTDGRARDVTVPPVDELPQPAIERQARFTTVEDEEARLRAQHRRPLLVVGVQLLALVGILAGFAALAYYLSRPPSAEELYQTISTRLDSDDASLSVVANEVDQFLERYPDHPRARELRTYQQRIELGKLERRLYRQARLSGATDPSLLPVEQMYLQAVSSSETEPDKAVASLEAIVALYGPRGSGEGAAQIADIVKLAKLRIAELKSQIAEQRVRQLKSMRERMDTAQRVAATDPETARAMYGAILELHADDAWAAEITAEARARLEEPGSE